MERRPIGRERHPDELPGRESETGGIGATQDHLPNTLRERVNALDLPILSPHPPRPNEVHEPERADRHYREQEPDDLQGKPGAVNPARERVMECQAGYRNCKKPVRHPPILVSHERSSSDGGNADHDNQADHCENPGP